MSTQGVTKPEHAKALPPAADLLFRPAQSRLMAALVKRVSRAQGIGQAFRRRIESVY